MSTLASLHAVNMYAGVSRSTRWQNDDLEPMRVKQKLKNSCSRLSTTKKNNLLLINAIDQSSSCRRRVPAYGKAADGILHY